MTTKMILALLALVVPASAQAQAFKQERAVQFSPVSPPGYLPDLRIPFDGWHVGDTPTMWEQRQKRVVAFRAKVAGLLQADGGALTPDNRRLIEQEWRRLRYHNR